MAEWALVENNTIQELHDLLPQNWRHVSGLNLSKNDLGFLRSLGWMPVMKDFSLYDERLHEIIGYDHELAADTVIERPRLKDRPPGYDPVPDLEHQMFLENRQRFLDQLRITRNQLLVRSDHTQLADLQSRMSEELQQQWAQYRQALRDIPQQYLGDDITEFVLASVSWPQEPANVVG